MNKTIICQRTDSTEAIIDYKEIAAINEIKADNGKASIIILKSGIEIQVSNSALEILSAITRFEPHHVGEIVDNVPT